MKGDFNILDLCKANASILYPQYPASTLQIAVSQTSGKQQLYYVAIFAIVTDPATGTASPRLLETGPPRLTCAEAIQSMFDRYLVKQVAKVVNDQARRVNRVEWKEGAAFGYQYLWPQDHHMHHASASEPIAGSVAPPPYEDAAAAEDAQPPSRRV